MSLATRNKVSVEFNMSSMTDIVFLLLVFFIILSTMVSPYGFKVNLPAGKLRTKEHPKISVTITPDLLYSIDGQNLSKEEVEGVLAKRKAELEKPIIVLRVDESVPTGETVGFMSVAKENGFEIVIATKPKQ
jgi:biopolymer transport protein ExbD